MSIPDSASRQTLGVGNLVNVYKAKPTPADVETLPVYINDELEALGGRLNNLLQGGVFPPLSQMPGKYKEGACFLFTQAVTDSAGVPLIPAAGLYIYFQGKWNRITLTAV